MLGSPNKEKGTKCGPKKMGCEDVFFVYVFIYVGNYNGTTLVVLLSSSIGTSLVAHALPLRRAVNLWCNVPIASFLLGCCVCVSEGGEELGD